jgi:ubiquinone/menaquinone biosynthesis C-methylase UbiE
MTPNPNKKGNLNWEAALELVAATVSISANYWPTSTVAAAESWMRGNTTAAIYDHRNQYEASLSSPLPPVQQVMDIGCSIGLSTKALLEAFPQASDIAALDLSPYFLSAAKFFLGTPESPMFSQNHDKVSYHHKLAESTTFTEGTYDVVSMSYVLHEVPTATAKEIIAEAFRVLRPGGTLSIVDLNGKRIKKLPQPRRHLFELTEPHINSYYKTDPVKVRLGFL